MNFTTNYKENNYEIIVEHEALKLDYDFTQYDKRIALIDENVYGLHSGTIESFLRHHNIEKILIPSGEQVKTSAHYIKFTEQILTMQVTRNSCLFAIGGGATGDFTGFIAATLLRGIHFVQIPTTILAHDASIGGKTGINATTGKNLIGAFKRPEKVIYDLIFLTTLSQTEKLSGFAEIIKHVILNATANLKANKHLLNLMNDIPDKHALRQLNEIERWITFGIKTKMQVILEDEFENGIRKHLNFGHTFGHAIEFHHKLPHGIAILHGMIFALILSGVENSELSIVLSWMRRLGLQSLNFDEFNIYYKLMQNDKKNEAAHINFVIFNESTGFHILQFEYVQLKQTFEMLRKLEGEFL